MVLTWLNGDAPERLFGELVTANYFDTLGLRPVKGRFFLPEEDRTPSTHAGRRARARRLAAALRRRARHRRPHHLDQSRAVHRDRHRARRLQRHRRRLRPGPLDARDDDRTGRRHAAAHLAARSRGARVSRRRPAPARRDARSGHREPAGARRDTRARLSGRQSRPRPRHRTADAHGHDDQRSARHALRLRAADGRRRPGPPDRLFERRQPAARAQRVAPSGGRVASRAGRGARPSRASVADRKRAARDDQRHRRPRGTYVGSQVLWSFRPPECGGEPDRSGDRHEGVVVRVDRVGHDRRDLRRDARVAGVARQSGRGVERGSASGRPHAPARQPGTRAAGGAGGAVARLADRRGALSARGAARLCDRSRFRIAAARDRDDQSWPGWLHARAERAVLPRRARPHRRDSWRHRRIVGDEFADVRASVAGGDDRRTGEPQR